jgi:hypothetical protein
MATTEDLFTGYSPILYTPDKKISLPLGKHWELFFPMLFAIGYREIGSHIKMCMVNTLCKS